MADAPTISELLDQVSALLGRRNLLLAQEQDWLVGTPTGGPNGDGLYPIDDSTGFTHMVPCPPLLGAQIAQTGILPAIRQGAPNLVPNSDFHNGLDKWTTYGDPGGWVPLPGYTIGPFVQYKGALGAGIYQDLSISDPLTHLSLSLEADPDAPGAFLAWLEWYGADGSKISDTSAKGLTTDGWLRASSAVFVPPSGAVRTRVVAAVQQANTYVRLTRFQVQAGPATNWQPSPFDIGNLTPASLAAVAALLPDVGLNDPPAGPCVYLSGGVLKFNPGS